MFTRKKFVWLFLLLWVCWGVAACGPAKEPEPLEWGTAVLHQIAPRVCPVPDMYADQAQFYHKFRSEADYTLFECTTATGHMTYTTLTWYDSQTEADAAFELQRGDSQVAEFHGFPLLMWAADDPSFPGGPKENQSWVWQAGQWLIHIRSFNDTNLISSPHPESVSDILYEVGQQRGLFALGQ